MTTYKKMLATNSLPICASRTSSATLLWWTRTPNFAVIKKIKKRHAVLWGSDERLVYQQLSCKSVYDTLNLHVHDSFVVLCSVHQINVTMIWMFTTESLLLLSQLFFIPKKKIQPRKLIWPECSIAFSLSACFTGCRCSTLVYPFAVEFVWIWISCFHLTIVRVNLLMMPSGMAVKGPKARASLGRKT